MSMGIAVVMLVLAMFVVVMIVVVVVTMIMMMAVIVRAMRMTGVVVCGFRVGVTAGIGAALGIERRLDLDDSRAQPLHHRLDDVIPADAQPLPHDLRRQMAVAEMPGDADQMLRIIAADFRQRFRRSHHFNQTAVFQHQRIAATQRDRVFQVEQEF